MKAVILIVILLAAMQAGPVYFQEDFTDVTDWGIYAGEGSLTTGGLIQSNTSVAFRRNFPEFNIWSTQYEIIIDGSNGSFTIWLVESTDQNLYHLINETQAGSFSAVMTSNIVISGIVIGVAGSVDFRSIRIFDIEGSERGGIFGFLEGLIMDFVAANPWFMPIVLGLGVVFVAGLLVFGKTKSRR